MTSTRHIANDASGSDSYSISVLLVLTILALATRALPYSFSSLPYNNDGMNEARIAGDILSSGHLTYPDNGHYVDSYSTLTPVYYVVLAFLSSSTGFDTFMVSQSMVAVLSVLIVVGGYAIALKVSRSLFGALSTATVLALLGTFVYLTGSSWKASLGVALLVLLVYAYMNRSDRRFLVLELVIVGCLPFTYHLATVLACLLLAYLTVWSMLIAIINKRVTSIHFTDLAVILVAASVAYVYYLETSFQRLSDYGSTTDILLMLAAFLVLAGVGSVVLIRREDLKFSFAPVAGTVVALLVLVDYYNPVFPYAQGYSSYVIAMGFMYGSIVAIGWYGLELLARSNWRCRAIPLGLLLPVMTLLLFALTIGANLESHKVFYRIFDYADVPLALGVGVVAASLSKARIRMAFAAVLVFILVCSFPFAYATSTLLGDRHDSQWYEVDAISWVYCSADSPKLLRSDERLSYNARALYDFEKDPYLPSRLVSGDLSSPGVMNLLLEEWMTTGVNDYPRGHPVLDESYVSYVLEVSNVMYIGGPASNNIVVFETTTVVFL